MSLTLESLAEEMRPHLNAICIVHDTEMGRLVGVCETEDDFYYLVHRMGQPAPTYFSAVGHCVSLKGSYPAKHYDRLDSVFSLNKAVPVPEFIVRREV